MARPAAAVVPASHTSRARARARRWPSRSTVDGSASVISAACLAAWSDGSRSAISTRPGRPHKMHYVNWPHSGLRALAQRLSAMDRERSSTSSIIARSSASRVAGCQPACRRSSPSAEPDPSRPPACPAASPTPHHRPTDAPRPTPCEHQRLCR